MKTKDITMIALFAALTAIGAWIAIPIQPVPFTFQVLFVLLSGALLGSVRGGISQIVYVLLGVVGLPVFAGGQSGIGVLFGPTGGYLIGFIVAAFAVGAVCSMTRGFWGNLTAMIIGIIVIYLFGLVQLMIVTNLGLFPALQAGVIPFILFDLIKAIIAAGITQKMRGQYFN